MTTRKDIIRMAREAGDTLSAEWLERFYLAAHAAGVAAERKRFASECIDLVAMYGGPVDLEAAIRARGQA